MPIKITLQFIKKLNYLKKICYQLILSSVAETV